VASAGAELGWAGLNCLPFDDALGWFRACWRSFSFLVVNRCTNGFFVSGYWECPEEIC
jgi:hypothetical protein